MNNSGHFVTRRRILLTQIETRLIITIKLLDMDVIKVTSRYQDGENTKAMLV